MYHDSHCTSEARTEAYIIWGKELTGKSRWRQNVIDKFNLKIFGF